MDLPAAPKHNRACSDFKVRKLINLSVIKANKNSESDYDSDFSDQLDSRYRQKMRPSKKASKRLLDCNHKLMQSYNNSQ